MRLLCVTDLHGRTGRLAQIIKAAGPVDAIAFGGDITDFGSPGEAEQIIRQAQQACVAVFAVAGNCDSAQIDQRLLELGVSLCGRGTICGSMGIHGLSAMPPWKPGMFQLTEAELARLLAAGYEQLAAAQQAPGSAFAHHVVLTHVPPRDTRLDRTIFGNHVGSAALRAFIEQKQPALVICGHIHDCLLYTSPSPRDS